jgi:uncharacterized protein (TIRG00374 family)
MTKRHTSRLLAAAISAGCVILLARAVNLHDLVALWRRPMLWPDLGPFLFMAAAIVPVFAWRWRLLLDGCISPRDALRTAVLGLGGNMFLPARAGDLVRAHYSRATSGMAYTQVFSRLLAEKLLDVLTIGVLGACAAVSLRAGNSRALVVTTLGFSLFAAAGGVLSLKLFAERFARVADRLQASEGSWRMPTRISALLRDLDRTVTWSRLWAPLLLSAAMWSVLYAAAYLLAARLVGVSLAYPELLLILVAGAAGLLIPAAPSGIGTFHGAVVSAFLLLGRPAAEGLLLATAIHLLFFAAYVLPAAFVYLRIRCATARLATK